MRNLERNKSVFYYAQLLREVSNKDEYDNEDGTYTKVYSEPIRAKASISSASGYAQAEQFGTTIQYDKVVITDDMTCPINENSILWLDIVPTDDSTPHDYIVKRVAKSLNCISIAISRVDVS